MLLTLVMILLLIWAAVVGSLYSSFLVFYTNFSESDHYNKAYYASIAALERAELVIKQRQPWYIWSGWWAWTHNWASIKRTGTWTFSWSDWAINGWFSYFGNNSTEISNVIRRINSITNRIPATWKGNVERMLSADDSSNYNAMNYEDAEVFLLYRDESKWNPYSLTNCSIANWWCTGSSIASITWVIRLPQKIKSCWWNWEGCFGNLDTQHPLVKDKVKNDAIVDWQLRWTYETKPFTIYATQATTWRYSPTVQTGKDTAIRESDLNGWLSLSFANSWNPKVWSIWTWFTIISQKSAEIEDDATHGTNKYFKFILSSPKVAQKQLRFSLLNLLKSANKSWMVYPFLEYYFEFWTWISDKYYTINAEWSYWEYQVNLIIQKPTAKESVLWNFTVVL